MKLLTHHSDNQLSYQATERLKVALFSSGLGNVNRGFEISTARFYRLLSNVNELDVKLYSGGDYPGAIKVFNIGRNQWLSAGLDKLPLLNNLRRWYLSYSLEQASFALGLYPHSFYKWQPDIIWTKEVPLAHVLYEYRRLFGLQYKIIFANGGGFSPRTYKQFDFIQHLQPEAYQKALQFGIDENKMIVLPNVVSHFLPLLNKQQIKKKYGFTETDWIVLTASAWNTHHKRIDYIINEVAKLNNPLCHLVICGQPEPEGLALQSQARNKLQNRIHWLTLSEESIQELMHASDVFVLASLYEGLGSVLIEAAMCGLPLICHNHASGYYITQDNYWLQNLSVDGALTECLRKFQEQGCDKLKLKQLQEQAFARFSQEALARQSLEMIEKLQR